MIRKTDGQRAEKWTDKTETAKHQSQKQGDMQF
jgi:hypothetical protein